MARASLVEDVIDIASVVIFAGRDGEMESSHYVITHERQILAGDEPNDSRRGNTGVRGGAAGGTPLTMQGSLHVSESRCD